MVPMSNVSTGILIKVLLLLAVKTHNNQSSCGIREPELVLLPCMSLISHVYVYMFKLSSVQTCGFAGIVKSY